MSLFNLAGPFPIRAATFFRPEKVYRYFNMLKMPAHLSEQHYLAGPGVGRRNTRSPPLLL